MELIKTKKHDKKNNSKPEPTQIHNVSLNVMVHRTNGFGDRITLTDADYLETQRLMKGVDWNDIALIQRGIATGGNVNYTYSNKNPYRRIYDTKKKIFIPDYSDPESYHNLIQIACRDKTYETVKALLTAPNIDIYAHEEGTKPAFELAVTRGDDSIIGLLMEHNPQTINIRDKNDNTLLHHVCRDRDVEKTQFLLKKSARTTIKNNDGFTPLAIAYFIKPSTFDLFYSKKLKKLVLNRDKNHNTQLHLAALLNINNVNYDEFKRYIDFLLSQGLSLWSRNKNNELPVDLASKKYTASCKECIEQSPLDQTMGYNSKIVNQELILHYFLQLSSSQKQCAPFMHLLQECLKDGFGNVPKELQNYIAKMYYIVNIETVVANKYKVSINYCHEELKLKEQIKYELLIKPEPELLWSA
jgi:hypothetical protein